MWLPRDCNVHYNLGGRFLKLAGADVVSHRFYIPTVCPSNNSASLLLYQSLPRSSELWRGHGQEAKRGEVGGPRLTRHVKRWSRFSSRVSPPGCPCWRRDA